MSAVRGAECGRAAGGVRALGTWGQEIMDRGTQENTEGRGEKQGETQGNRLFKRQLYYSR